MENDLIEDITVVNIVGSGSIGKEISLDALSEDLPGEVYGKDVDYPGLFQDTENNATNTFYRKGSFVIRNSPMENFKESKKELLNTFEELGIIDDSEMDTGFKIVNVIVSASIDEEIRLTPMAIGLGLEHTEYSPEQFPALVYRRKKYPCTFLLFQSGAIIATGGTDIEETKKSVVQFVNEVEQYLNPTEVDSSTV